MSGRPRGADEREGEVPEIAVEALRERLAGGGADRVQSAAASPARVVDVREDWEWASGHIAGATHIPLGQLPARLGELDGTDEVYFICHLGGRSEMATRFAREHGLTGATNVQGGMDAWEARGYPVTT